MKLKIWLLLSVSMLAACQENSAQSGKDDDPFRHIEYRLAFGKHQEPQALTEHGTVSGIDISAYYGYQKISGDDLLLQWKGEVSLAQDEMRVIQMPDNGFATDTRVRINGEEAVRGKVPFLFKKGRHQIDVMHAPKWSSFDFVVNFLPHTEFVSDVSALYEKIGVQAEDDIFVIVSGFRNEQNNIRPLILPASKTPLLLVLDSYPLGNWEISNPDNTPVKAIVLLNGSGTVSGISAPVYRIDGEIGRHIIPGYCSCTGGTHFSCVGDEGSLPAITAYTQALFRRPPDHIGELSARLVEPATKLPFQFTPVLNVIPFVDWQTMYDKRVAEVAAEKSKCGGENALTPDNAFPASGRPWSEQLGIQGIPRNDGFKAVYFHQDQPQKILHLEHVPEIAINYPYEQFHGLDSQKFMALWIGKKTFSKETPMSLQFDFRWGQLRIWVDGEIVFNKRHGENGIPQHDAVEYVFSPGEHTIEVEYINHWHTTQFALNFIPEQPVLDAKTIRKLIEDRGYSVVRATVDESSRIDSVLPVSLPRLTRPTVLILQSNDKVFWEIAPAENLEMVLIKEHQGDVRSSAPVVRVSDLPPVKTEKSFYQHDVAEIKAEQFKSASSKK